MTTSTNIGHNWAGLPRDLLSCVLQKLELFADFVRFGAVCKSWRSTTLDVHNQEQRTEYQLSSYHHHKVPLLLFHPPMVESSEEEKMWCCLRSLYSVTQERVLPDPLKFVAADADAWCFGSSHGWLITGSTTIASDIVFIKLINPFYSGGHSRCHHGVIQLPPLKMVYGDIIGDLIALNPVDIVKLGMTKVILFGDPVDGEYMVLALFNSLIDYMALFKSGNKEWTYIHNEFGCIDGIIHKQNLYFLTNQESVMKLNPKCAKPMLQAMGLHLLPKSMPHIFARVYMVESPTPDPEPLLVNRYIRYKHNPDVGSVIEYTCGFEVYKILEKDGTENSWVRVESLGNGILFLEDKCCTSILVDENEDCGLQPNSIYFTERTSGNIGIYKLDDQVIQTTTLTYSVGKKSPVWFLPSIPHPRSTAQNVNIEV